MSLGGNPVAVVQLPSGQFQVQGVIQSAQSSVIQSPQAHAQVTCIPDLCFYFRMESVTCYPST